jgi:hypothetical protein
MLFANVLMPTQAARHGLIPNGVCYYQYVEYLIWCAEAYHCQGLLTLHSDHQTVTLPIPHPTHTHDEPLQ